MLLHASGAVRHALSAAEAGSHIAARLGLSKALTPFRVWELARNGALPCCRLGRRVYFVSEDIDRYLDDGGAVLSKDACSRSESRRPAARATACATEKAQ
jgi:hypothetical protein